MISVTLVPGGKEENGPVSAWRMLLIANEWNELQTQRITSPGLTLLFLVSAVQRSRTLSPEPPSE